MDNVNDVKLYRSYLLPPNFWAALVELRAYLLLDDEFTIKVTNPLNRDETLHAAFTLMDSIVDRAQDYDWIGASGQ